MRIPHFRRCRRPVTHFIRHSRHEGEGERRLQTDKSWFLAGWKTSNELLVCLLVWLQNLIYLGDWKEPDRRNDLIESAQSLIHSSFLSSTQEQPKREAAFHSKWSRNISRDYHLINSTISRGHMGKERSKCGSEEPYSNRLNMAIHALEIIILSIHQTCST